MMLRQWGQVIEGKGGLEVKWRSQADFAQGKRSVVVCLIGWGHIHPTV